jgi:hypothetical protein
MVCCVKLPADSWSYQSNTSTRGEHGNTLKLHTHNSVGAISQTPQPGEHGGTDIFSGHTCKPDVTRATPCTTTIWRSLEFYGPEKDAEQPKAGDGEGKEELLPHRGQQPGLLGSCLYLTLASCSIL